MMRIRVFRENGSLDLQPILYIADMSKLIHTDKNISKHPTKLCIKFAPYLH